MPKGDGYSDRISAEPVVWHLSWMQSAAAAAAATGQGCSGAGTRGGRRPPTFFDREDASPTPPLFGLKFVQKLVHGCNWLLTETQCEIVSVQQN